eukprot:344754_1
MTTKASFVILSILCYLVSLNAIEQCPKKVKKKHFNLIPGIGGRCGDLGETGSCAKQILIDLVRTKKYRCLVTQKKSCPDYVSGFSWWTSGKYSKVTIERTTHFDTRSLSVHKYDMCVYVKTCYCDLQKKEDIVKGPGPKQYSTAFTQYFDNDDEYDIVDEDSLYGIFDEEESDEDSHVSDGELYWYFIPWRALKNMYKNQYRS